MNSTLSTIIPKIPMIFMLVGMFLLVYIVCYVPAIYGDSVASTHVENGFFDTWHKCISSKLGGVNEPVQMWGMFQGNAKLCQMEAKVHLLPVVSLRNHDETKYALLPVNLNDTSTNILVTLGIGNDITAEQALQQKMNESGLNITFYGADPITALNDDLYSKIGKYFPFAVGKKAGFSQADVLLNGKYVAKNVVYVDIIYFLIEMLQVRTYDHIWFDAEGAEYETFDIFYKNGWFDDNGITFCQMSLEVHKPSFNQKEQFMVFVKQILADRRFGFFHIQNVGHMRMWFFNFESQYCKKKFLPAELIT